MPQTATLWHELHPGTLLAERGPCKSYQLKPNLYVFEMEGHLTSELMFKMFEDCWRAPGFVRPYGVVCFLTNDVTYDPDLRTFAETPGLISAAAVGIVVEKVLARMVLSTVGIATRLKHGTALTTHSDFSDALQAVQRALDGATAG